MKHTSYLGAGCFALIAWLVWQASFSQDQPERTGRGLAPLADKGLVRFAQETTPPLGAIIGWHKTLAGQGDLPRGWIECNGQEIPYGPLAGKKVPDLNGERRFLRGGAISGIPEADQVVDHSHRHNFSVNDHTHGLSPGAWSQPLNRVRPGDTTGVRNYGNPDGGRGNAGQIWPDHEPIYETKGVSKTPLNVAGGILGAVKLDDNKVPVGGRETRPTNVSVVWIMRIE